MQEVEYDFEQAVDSSAIRRVIYNTETNELYVVFPGGNMAGYKDVEPDAVKEFVNSYSVGSYYAREIRGRYRGINTKDIVFRKVEPKTVASNSSVSSSRSWNVVPSEKYSVTFVTTVTIEINANSIEDAISSVKQGNPNATVTEVKKV